MTLPRWYLHMGPHWWPALTDAVRSHEASVLGTRQMLPTSWGTHAAHLRNAHTAYTHPSGLPRHDLSERLDQFMGALVPYPVEPLKHRVVFSASTHLSQRTYPPTALKNRERDVGFTLNCFDAIARNVQTLQRNDETYSPRIEGPIVPLPPRSTSHVGRLILSRVPRSGGMVRADEGGRLQIGWCCENQLAGFTACRFT